MHTRRTLLATAGAVVSGGIVTSQITQDAQAQVSVDGFNLNDETIETTNEITSVELEANGSFSHTTNADPTRIVIRLEAATGNNTLTQVGAMEPDVTASNYTVSGSLDSLEGMDTLLPTEPTGETNTQITARVSLEVYVDGEEVTTASSQDTVTLTVTHGSVALDSSIDGQGGLIVDTATN